MPVSVRETCHLITNERNHHAPYAYVGLSLQKLENCKKDDKTFQRKTISTKKSTFVRFTVQVILFEEELPLKSDGKVLLQIW